MTSAGIRGKGLLVPRCSTICCQPCSLFWTHRVDRADHTCTHLCPWLDCYCAAEHAAIHCRPAPPLPNPELHDVTSKWQCRPLQRIPIHCPNKPSSTQRTRSLRQMSELNAAAMQYETAWVKCALVRPWCLVQNTSRQRCPAQPQQLWQLKCICTSGAAQQANVSSRYART